MSLLRSRAIICLLAIVAQIATPGLVLCQEIDGSIQIEFARDGCCKADAVDADAARVNDSGACALGEAAKTYVGPSSTDTPDCACEQDTSLSPLVTRPRPGLIDQADLNTVLPVGDHPALLSEGSAAHTLPPVRLHPLHRGGVLAALRTIVLRN